MDSEFQKRYREFKKRYPEGLTQPPDTSQPAEKEPSLEDATELLTKDFEPWEADETAPAGEGPRLSHHDSYLAEVYHLMGIKPPWANDNKKQLGFCRWKSGEVETVEAENHWQLLAHRLNAIMRL